MRALIVEDDDASRDLLIKMLSPFGRCDGANEGHEGLKAVLSALSNGTPYDLICLDIMMPKVDGLQALRRIHKLEHEYGVEEGEGAKIIMITASVEGENIKKAMNEGCAAYVLKPITKEKLFSVVKPLGIIKEFKY